MMSFKIAILLVISLSAGIVIAGGVFAFLSLIGVFPILLKKTHTAADTYVFENLLILGGMIGNVFTVYQPRILLGPYVPAVFGLFFGIFIGCVSMAIAEVLRVIPILLRRIHLAHGLGYLITSIAVGKMIGSLVQLLQE
ncbi:MAG: stage V sporulation protein AB [Lachnospiraceae bacterium]|nr:stage V sporulation protein AB [Lachnospiraceae bacterium]